MRMLARVLGAIGVVLALGSLGLMCQRVLDRGRFALPYSALGSGPEGTRALFMLVREEGLEPRRWAEDLLRLPEGSMLIALGGCEQISLRTLARTEREHLVGWVERGGTLVVAGVPEYVPEDLGVRLDAPTFEECFGHSGLLGMMIRASRRARDAGPPVDGGAVDGGVPSAPDAAGPPDAGAIETLEPGSDGAPLDDPWGDEPPPYEDPADFEDLPEIWEEDPEAALEEVLPDEDLPEMKWAIPMAPELQGIGSVGMRRPGLIMVERGIEARPLLGFPDRPAAIEVRRGRGRLVVLASASSLTNRDLLSSGGVVLFARMLRAYRDQIRGGLVVFDEYHLGAGERRGAMRWLSQAGLMPLVLQLLVIALALGWRWGVRFGAPARELTDRPESSATFVGAVGALLSKSRDSRGALAILARPATAAIAAAHRIETHDPVRLVEALRERKRVVAAEAVRAIGARLAPEHERPDLVTEIRALDVERDRALSDRGIDKR